MYYLQFLKFGEAYIPIHMLELFKQLPISYRPNTVEGIKFGVNSSVEQIVNVPLSDVIALYDSPNFDEYKKIWGNFLVFKSMDISKYFK